MNRTFSAKRLWLLPEAILGPVYQLLSGHMSVTITMTGAMLKAHSPPVQRHQSEPSLRYSTHLEEKRQLQPPKMLHMFIPLQSDIQIQHARREMLPRNVLYHLRRHLHTALARAVGRLVIAPCEAREERRCQVVNDGSEALVFVQAGEVARCQLCCQRTSLRQAYVREDGVCKARTRRSGQGKRKAGIGDIERCGAVRVHIPQEPSPA